MSNIKDIGKIKPSALNPFDGNFDGSEIVQVTRPGIGTYKATTSQMRNFYTIIAMTEEEFNKLENPIEGAFYATYE